MAQLILEKVICGEELAPYITEQQPQPVVEIPESLVKSSVEYRLASQVSATHFLTRLNYDLFRILRDETERIAEQLQQQGLEISAQTFNTFNFRDGEGVRNGQGIFAVLFGGRETYPKCYDRIGDKTAMGKKQLPHLRELPRFTVSVTVENRLADPEFGRFIGILCPDGYH